MSVYAIFLDKPDKAAWDAIESKWPERYILLNDRFAFVAPEGITTTADIRNVVGINEEVGRLGVIVEEAAITGFYRSDLWEWLRKVKP